MIQNYHFIYEMVGAFQDGESCFCCVSKWPKAPLSGKAA